MCKQRESLRDKYLLEMKRRKKLYNQVVELKGNIRVFCRVRPKITEDGCGMFNLNVFMHRCSQFIKNGTYLNLHTCTVQCVLHFIVIIICTPF